jgi:hypothetical protein
LFETVLHGLAGLVHNSQPDGAVLLTIRDGRSNMRRMTEDGVNGGYVVSDIVHGTYGFFLGDFSFFEMLGEETHGLAGKEDDVFEGLTRDNLLPFADARFMCLDGALREGRVLKVRHV